MVNSDGGSTYVLNYFCEEIRLIRAVELERAKFQLQHFSCCEVAALTSEPLHQPTL